MEYSIDKRPIMELFEISDPLAQQKTAFLRGEDTNKDTADTTFNAMSGFRKETAAAAHNAHLNKHLEQHAGGSVVDAAEEAKHLARM